MKKPLVFFLITLSCVFSTVSFAQDQNSNSEDKEKTKNIPLRPGMELRRIGNINLIVPEGAELYKTKGQPSGSSWIESEDVYAARRFKQMDERLGGIEDRISKMEEDIKGLRVAMENASKK